MVTKKCTVTFTFALALVAACFIVLPMSAHAPSGAIFTTTATGDEVNANQFSAKEDVYLDGGPGPGAPQTAAGLDDGTYVFQVTDPSGKTLLSTDAVECRQFTVSDGIITGVTGPCPHAMGDDIDNGAKTVQLFPYDDTPNPGGVYKVWVTNIVDWGLGGDCSLASTGTDCAVGKHGFIPSHSKTDNFKVKVVPIREVDTFFIDQNTGQHMAGLKSMWVDTVGVSNNKWSYYVPFWDVTEAHVEAVENGDHQIVIEEQPGCTTIEQISLTYEDYEKSDTTYLGPGPRAVPVTMRGTGHQNVFVRVYCRP
jgi:hypothetical protein